MNWRAISTNIELESISTGGLPHALRLVEEKGYTVHNNNINDQCMYRDTHVHVGPSEVPGVTKGHFRCTTMLTHWSSQTVNGFTVEPHFNEYLYII